MSSGCETDFSIDRFSASVMIAAVNVENALVGILAWLATAAVVVIPLLNWLIQLFA
jgi:hypothetical protein